MKRKLGVILVALLVFLVASSAWAGARPDKSWKSWFGHFYAGYDFASGSFGDGVDDGWQLGGGATWWPETAPVGLKIDLGYNNFDISQRVIGLINDATDDGDISSGDVDIWSLTANVIWGPDSGGPVGFYLTGGVGVYYLQAQVGTPGVFTGWICDPWTGWCYPGAVPGTVITGSESTTDWGYNAGLGLTIEVGQSGSQIYFEALYHSVQTEGITADYIPIAIGYRW